MKNLFLILTLFTVSISVQAMQQPAAAAKKHVCADCGQGFVYQSALQAHERIHTGERPYVCTYEGCGKRFTRSGDLQRHECTHTGDRPYVCTYEGCGKRFAYKSVLKTHVSTHTGERPYACTYQDCGKRFADPSSLQAHHRTHTGEKPYTCTYEGCGKKFAQSSNLKEHERIHTGERPYVCETCQKAFANSSNLKKHQKKQNHTVATALGKRTRAATSMVAEAFAMEPDVQVADTQHLRWDFSVPPTNPYSPGPAAVEQQELPEYTDVPYQDRNPLLDTPVNDVTTNGSPVLLGPPISDEAFADAFTPLDFVGVPESIDEQVDSPAKRQRTGGY